jgi:TatD DNase family protein
MRSLPPLDVHAHVDPTIAAHELASLGAIVFAVTRSLDEAETALARTDADTIWGVGCHPGLVGAHTSFSSDRFATLIRTTPFVGEIGLDGKSRVPMETQVATLRAMLRVLHDQPRIATIHSYAATGAVLRVLSECDSAGAVLHWWLGTIEETARAVDIGCYFSINAAMTKRDDLLRAIPLARALTETDHPFGDRSMRGERRPGFVTPVETALARVHGASLQMIRLQVWQNLRALSGETSVGSLLPTTVRRHLAAV